MWRSCSARASRNNLRARLGAVLQRLAEGLIIAGIGALVLTAQDSVPTFGTTVVVPGGLLGLIYDINPLSQALPYFPSLDPLGVIYTSSLNVPTRNFRAGFPGVTNRYEWFAIDYSGRFWIDKAGLYRFELTSDDGSKLYIDDQVVVDNDGVHSTETRTAEFDLARGIHRIRVSYFQGPGNQVALVLRVARPGEEWRIFSTEEFKPPPDPATWMSLGQLLHISSVTSAPGEKARLEISLDWSAARAPTALKWVVVFPAQLLELEGDGPELGEAAMNSHKSLTCALRQPYSSACVLAGGQNPVLNGLIAIYHFRVRSTADAGTAVVRIERAEAVTVDSKALTLDNAEGTVTIQP